MSKINLTTEQKKLIVKGSISAVAAGGARLVVKTAAEAFMPAEFGVVKTMMYHVGVEAMADVVGAAAGKEMFNTLNTFDYAMQMMNAKIKEDNSEDNETNENEE